MSQPAALSWCSIWNELGISASQQEMQIDISILTLDATLAFRRLCFQRGEGSCSAAVDEDTN